MDRGFGDALVGMAVMIAAILVILCGLVGGGVGKLLGFGFLDSAGIGAVAGAVLLAVATVCWVKGWW